MWDAPPIPLCGGAVFTGLVLSIALASPSQERPRKRPRAVRPAAEVAAYHPTGTGVDPALLPLLIGRTETLELEGLRRTTIRFDVSHDGLVLGQLDPTATRVLHRQLAADPSWRLTRLRDTWVATRREPGPDGWTSGPEGYHLGETCWRVGVRLGEAATGYPWAGGGPITVLRADDQGHRVWAIAIDDPPCRGQRAVALVAHGGDVAIEVLDSGSGDRAARVEEALTDLPIDLANAAIDGDLVAARGFDPDQLGAPLPTRPAAPGLRARPDGLEFTAALHLDEAQLCWVRVVRDGAGWQEAAVAEATLEAPGWSSNPSDLFLLQSRVPVRVETPFDATIELWCRPDSGPAARLASTEGRVGAP